MPSAKDIADRAGELKKRHDTAFTSRQRVRAILNGGVGAIQALLGSNVTDADLPWPNLMLSGLTRLAQKIGDVPTVTCLPPTTTDSERARKRSEKRERIVRAYDTYDRMELQLPQVGRWLPGYGFAVWTLEQGLTPDGDPYPRANLRDPFDAYPGDWGADQQPRELAIYRRISPNRLKSIYPHKAAAIDKMTAPANSFDWAGGGLLLRGGNWEGNHQTSTGVSIVEFYDTEGTWVVTADGAILLDYIPNPLGSTPAFVVAKRFSFDQLNGQYDHVIGLTAAMAKINILAIIAMEDAVFAPVNIAGEAPKPRYRQGRFAVNVVPPGTTISRDMANLPYQVFEEGNRVERQLRLVAGYPVSDDAQSPMSFATGRGLEELNTSITNEIYEYHKVLKHAMQDLDCKRLEWDQALYGSRRKALTGERKGARYSENYIPSTDIGGDYKTQRRYGVFAGFDKTESIIVGLQLLDARLLDPLSVQESIDGLAELDLAVINERIKDNDATQILYQLLAQAAQNQDPRAIMAFVEMLPEGETKTIMQKFFTPQEPQMSPEEQAMAGQGQEPAGPPPDVVTALRRVALNGPAAGVQTVSRMNQP
jgi:hypothetical protein